MAICIEFELIEIKGTIAKYQYGECLTELHGLFEVDVTILITREVSSLSEVVRLLPSEYMNQSMANRACIKIYKYYLEHNKYPKRGGYYA
jgi:hypothetical protein